ncbi:MAG: TonB-dependent receptor [Pseudomonadota bacterium]|nr:TonB-dependent receptor [Pseudomonadota bacterium]
MALIALLALAVAQANAAPLDGRVLDQSTGLPIVGAEAIASGVVLTTNAKGRFTLDLPAGTPVTFRAPGFMEATFAVPASTSAVDWRVRLYRESGALEIVVEARRDDPVVSVTSLDRERVERTPGTFEDPVRLVQSLPGVSITPEYSPKAGDISIRGAAPGENRFLLDGIDLPYLFHFNGYSSVFHTRMLEELTLWPSTYGANWGGATGGIVETKSRWDRPDGVRGTINLNLVMGGAEVRVPIGKKWVLRASGRRSYLDAFSRDDEQYTVFPQFWDYFARAEYVPGEGRQWGVLAFGAGDAYTRYVGEPTELVGWEQETNPSFEYDQQYHVAGVVHRERFGRTRTDGVLAFVDYRVTGDVPSASEGLHEQSLQLREDLVTAPIDALSIAYGLEVKASNTRVTSETTQAWPELARESALLARGISASLEQPRLTGGAYVEGRIELGPVRLVPGVRVGYDTLTATPTVDPRFLARWAIGPDTRARFGIGRYSQYPTVTQLAPTLGDPDAGPSHAEQVAVGFDHAIAGRWEVGLDGWAKRMDGLFLTELDGSLRSGVVGEAWGVEVTSRYRIRDRFFASVGLAFGHATRDGEVFDYDQPWSGNIAASWTFHPTWNIGVRYRLAAGLPYTPVEDGLYQAASDTYTPLYGERNSARYVPYQKVDAHLEKTFHTRLVQVTAYTELWWVPEVSNVMYLAYRYDYDASAPVAGPGFIPLVGVRVER